MKEGAHPLNSFNQFPVLGHAKFNLSRLGNALVAMLSILVFEINRPNSQPPATAYHLSRSLKIAIVISNTDFLIWVNACMNNQRTTSYACGPSLPHPCSSPQCPVFPSSIWSNVCMH